MIGPYPENSIVVGGLRELPAQDTKLERNRGG